MHRLQASGQSGVVMAKCLCNSEFSCLWATALGRPALAAEISACYLLCFHIHCCDDGRHWHAVPDFRQWATGIRLLEMNNALCLETVAHLCIRCHPPAERGVQALVLRNGIDTNSLLEHLMRWNTHFVYGTVLIVTMQVQYWQFFLCQQVLLEQVPPFTHFSSHRCACSPSVALHCCSKLMEGPR